MQKIGDEMQAATGALNLQDPRPQVLDLCMAPGGYSKSVLKYSPHARVLGVTLPADLGGHKLLIPRDGRETRVSVCFTDITMLASEFGVTDLPKDHPDISNFSDRRLWLDEAVDLVFCDGQVLRTHTPHIASYRECCEATRLTCSQLILALQRIKCGGTLIMLLHKVDAWRTMKLLSTFEKFAEIELFKPVKCHGTRSSFYLIAKNVQPHSAEALAALREWKASWKNATFPPSTDGRPQGLRQLGQNGAQKGEIQDLLAVFGETLIELGEPIWQIQSEALSKADWLKDKGAAISEAGAALETKRGSSTSVDAASASILMGHLRIADE